MKYVMLVLLAVVSWTSPAGAEETAVEPHKTALQQKETEKLEVTVTPSKPYLLPDGRTKIVVKKESINLGRQGRTGRVQVIVGDSVLDIVARTVIAAGGYYFEFSTAPVFEFGEVRQDDMIFIVVSKCRLTVRCTRKKRPLIHQKRLKKEVEIECIRNMPCQLTHTIRGEGNHFVSIKPTMVEISNYAPSVTMNVTSNFGAKSIKLDFKKKAEVTIGKQMIAIESFGFDPKANKLKIRIHVPQAEPAEAAIVEYRSNPLVVMLGDSTTERGMPKQTKKQLDERIESSRQSPTVINAGKGGDNATAALDRLEKDVLSRHPDIVTVSFGLNDTGGLKPDQFKESLKKIVQKLKYADIKVILVTSTPFDNNRHGWGKQKQFQDLGGLDEYMDREFCEKMRSLAKANQIRLCDLHSIFKEAFKKDHELLGKVISGDGVHLTAEGNVLAARHIAPVIHTLLTE
jgi:lysophospholipase L1-like esterase